MKNKGWIIFGIFVIAVIIALAIYRVAGTKDTVIVSGGGSQTKSTNGLGSLLSSFNLKGLFSGLFGGGGSSSGDNSDQTYEG